MRNWRATTVIWLKPFQRKNRTANHCLRKM